MSILVEISELLQKGKAPKVKTLVQEALDQGIAAQEILDNALLHGMGVIGGKFKNNEVFVPEVLVAARAMNRGLDVLKPHLAVDGSEKKGTAIIGTVKGDLHDIGKNLVKIMIEGKGIDVIDLGVDVEAQAFIDKAIEVNADVICCSALLTTTMGEMKNVVEALNASEIKDKVKIMVGGAPITQAFCEKIGADIYTADAASASEVALELCAK